MEIFTKMCRCSTFLAAIGLVAFFGCGKVDLVDDLAFNQESFTRATSLTVTGQVVDPETDLPVAGAKIKSNSFTTTTDSNGKFSANLTSFTDTDVIMVSREGYVDYQFAANYADSSDGATLTWQINLPQRQQCVWVGPNEGAWYRYVSNGVEYVIDIRRGAVREWTEVCVSPNGTVTGEGIGLAFSRGGMISETPRSPGNFLTFLHPVDVRGFVFAGDTEPDSDTDPEVDPDNPGPNGGLVNPGQSLFLYYLPSVGGLIPGGGVIYDATFYPFGFFPTLTDLNTSGNPDGDAGNGGNSGNSGANSSTPISLVGNPEGVEGLPHQAVGDGGG